MLVIAIPVRFSSDKVVCAAQLKSFMLCLDSFKYLSRQERGEVGLVVRDESADHSVCESLLADLANYGIASELMRTEPQPGGIHQAFDEVVMQAMQQKPKGVFFLGSDAYTVQYSWLATLRQWIGKLDNPGAVHCLTFDINGIVDFGGAREGGDERFGGAHKHEVIDSPIKQPWLSHTAIWLSYDALVDAQLWRIDKEWRGHLYSYDYQLYCGDRELAYIIRSCGYNLYLLPQIKFTHAGGLTVRGLKQDYIVIAKRDKALLESRWKETMESWKE
jgi:hypothetical protein